MSGIGTALRTELFVSLRNWKLWLLLITPALAAAIRLLLIRLNTASANLQNALGGRTNLDADYAYGYFVDALSTGLIFTYLIFVALAAFTFAVDRDHGVIRHLVIRQSSRRAVVAAKVLLLHGMATLTCSFIIISALIITAWLWDFGPVVEDGYELISVAEIHTEIRTGIILALLPLPACLCMGMLFSVLANSALQAISLSLGITLLLDMFKGAFAGGAKYLYIYFQPSLLDNSYLKEVARIARGFSDILIDEKVMQLNYWLPIPQAALFLLIAMLWVRRKSL